MTNIVFSGKLEFLKLPELLQIIGNNEFSGVLKLQSLHHPAPGFIYFKNGNPVASEFGTLTGIEALYTFFGWQAGDFIFSNERTRKKRTIHKNRMGIIMNGLRLIDEGKTKIVKSQSGLSSAEKNAPNLAKMAEVKGPPVDYVYIVDEESFRDGEVIAKEGWHGQWIWVVLGGMVEITKETKNGSLVIRRISEGAFIGSFTSFLPRDHMRSAAAIARGDVHLGVLDTARLSGEFAALSPAFRHFIIGMDNRLSEVTGRLVEIRKKQAVVSGVPKGFKLFSLESKREGGLFIIKKGEAAVVRNTDDGPVLLANLSIGDSFGHVPFLEIEHEPYAASIYSSPDLGIARLDSKGFESEFRRLSITFRNLIEHVSACIAVTTQLVVNALQEVKGAETPMNKQKHGDTHPQREDASGGKTVTEKRSADRINTRSLSFIIVNDKETAIHQGLGRTLNLSETGVLLDTHFPIESGCTVMISIGLAEDLVNAKGKVVHDRQLEDDSFASGICFGELTDAAIRVIKKFIQTYEKRP